MIYADLIDHILLLRRVLGHPEMTREGPMLDHFINEYRRRMTEQEMTTKQQQLALPWQVEWIWHIHRLHPLDYDKDCKAFGSRILIDKKAYNLITPSYTNSHSKMRSPPIGNDLPSFASSIDLVQGAIRQRDFLEKFQRHRLYSHTFTEHDHSDFDQLVQNYVAFLKLARKNEMIVPTFDIDLIWHSHMRRPSQYQACSIALCGFVLDHDDSIDKDTLSKNYQLTIDRWKQTYNIDYGQNVHRKTVPPSRDVSSSSGCSGFSLSAAFQNASESICSGGGDGGCGGGCGGD